MDILPLQSSPRCDPVDDSSPGNLAAWDVLRVAAAFGVVALHACVPYLKHPMPGLQWAVNDDVSPTLDCVFWAIEVFIMPVFLVIAGVLAWQSLQRRGPKRLVSGRLKRLGKPLLFGLCVILPIDLYVWLGGWIYEGRIDPIKIKSLKIEGLLGDHLWGTGHLWFLAYLMTYVVTLAAVVVGTGRILGEYRSDDRASGGRDCRKHRTAIFAFMIVAVGVVTLSLRPEVVWGFQHAFAPVPSKWIYSGTFFVGGVLLARQSGGLAMLQNHASRCWMPAACLLIAAVLLGRWSLAGHEPGTVTGKSASVVLAGFTNLAAWAVTLSAIGLGLKHFRRATPAVSYLAAASFWIYLAHHPLLGLIHIDLKYLLPGWSPTVKGLAAFVIATGVSLLIYEAFVRKTRLGAWLGMQWGLREETGKASPTEIVILHELEVAATPRRRRAA